MSAILLCRDRLIALPSERHVYHKIDRVAPDEKAEPEDHPRLSQKLWNSSWWKETRVPEAVELKYDAQVAIAPDDVDDFTTAFRIAFSVILKTL